MQNTKYGRPEVKCSEHLIWTDSYREENILVAGNKQNTLTVESMLYRNPIRLLLNS